MLKKTVWMFVVLAVLLVISAGAALAAGMNRSVQASLSPSGSAAILQLRGTGGSQYWNPHGKLDSHGHCFLGEDAAAAEAAY